MAWVWFVNQLMLFEVQELIQSMHCFAVPILTARRSSDLYVGVFLNGGPVFVQEGGGPQTCEIVTVNDASKLPRTVVETAMGGPDPAPNTMCRPMLLYTHLTNLHHIPGSRTCNGRAGQPLFVKAVFRGKVDEYLSGWPSMEMRLSNINEAEFELLTPPPLALICPLRETNNVCGSSWGWLRRRSHPQPCWCVDRPAVLSRPGCCCHCCSIQPIRVL